MGASALPVECHRWGGVPNVAPRPAQGDESGDPKSCRTASHHRRAPPCPPRPARTCPPPNPHPSALQSLAATGHCPQGARAAAGARKWMCNRGLRPSCLAGRLISPTSVVSTLRPAAIGPNKQEFKSPLPQQAVILRSSLLLFQKASAETNATIRIPSLPDPKHLAGPAIGPTPRHHREERGRKVLHHDMGLRR